MFVKNSKFRIMFVKNSKFHALSPKNKRKNTHCECSSKEVLGMFTNFRKTLLTRNPEVSISIYWT